MAVNPFFLHGSSTEQSLIQDLVNEQLKMYGIDVYYLPRKIINKDTILQEVQTSKFDNAFIIEAYINNVDGYSGAGDIMTKFGMSLRDEVTLTISRERFEEFISPILQTVYGPDASHRPREGDLIYFPLGQRLFEIKFVEHEKPFYQLKKNYVYELQCELFEYENEEIDTSIVAIDDAIKDLPFTELTLLASTSVRATANAVATYIQNNDGFVRKIILNDDGNGYKSSPNVAISTSPVGLSTANATAVAITTSVGDAKSVLEILITNTGYGYTTAPTVTITGGGGVGAAATALLQQSDNWVSNVILTNAGSGYRNLPSSISISNPDVATNTAPTLVGILTSSNGGSISQIAMRDVGTGGYQQQPVVTISEPFSQVGMATAQYKLTETVTGEISGTTAAVSDWDINTRKLKVYSQSGNFLAGENIIGSESGAKYNINAIATFGADEPFAKNDEFEQEADSILDLSEDKPFGTY